MASTTCNFEECPEIHSLSRLKGEDILKEEGIIYSSAYELSPNNWLIHLISPSDVPFNLQMLPGHAKPLCAVNSSAHLILQKDFNAGARHSHISCSIVLGIHNAGLRSLILCFRRLPCGRVSAGPNASSLDSFRQRLLARVQSSVVAGEWSEHGV